MTTNFQFKIFRKLITALLAIALFSRPSVSFCIKCNYEIKDYDENTYEEAVLKKVYTCDGVMETNDDEDLSVSANHLNGKTLDDIEMLKLSGKNISSLPEGMPNCLPNLLGLKVTETNLKTISSEDLRYPKLKALYICTNKLRTLDGNLLMHMPNLVMVGFNYNEITNVGTKLLDNLPHLRFLYFDHNICTKDIMNLHAMHGDMKTIKSIKKVLKEKCPPTPKMIEKENRSASKKTGRKTGKKTGKKTIRNKQKQV